MENGDKVFESLDYRQEFIFDENPTRNYRKPMGLWFTFYIQFNMSGLALAFQLTVDKRSDKSGMVGNSRMLPY